MGRHRNSFRVPALALTFWAFVGSAWFGGACSGAGSDEGNVGDVAVGDLAGAVDTPARQDRVRGDVDSDSAVAPRVVPDFGHCRFRSLRSGIFFATYDTLETGLSTGSDATCLYMPAGRWGGRQAELVTTAYTWSVSQAERDALWAAVMALDWSRVTWEHQPDFTVPHAPHETISLVCDDTELIIGHFFGYLDEDSPNLALHDLIQEKLWPRECEPWPHEVLQEADVAPGWSRTVLPGVSATSVAGCGDGLVHFNDKEIWLSDGSAADLALLPSVTAGIADDNGDAQGNRVESVACAGGQVLALVSNGFREWSTQRRRRLAVFDTEDPAAGWVDISDAFGPGRLVGLAGSRDVAVVFGENGVVVRDGTGDLTTFSETPVWGADVTRRPGLDALWALRRDPPVLYHAFDVGNGWRDRERSLPADTVEGWLQYESLGTESVLLDSIGGLCVPTFDTSCEVIGGPTDEHGWVRLGTSESSSVPVWDWRLMRGEGGVLVEHAVQLSRVVPDPALPPEPILWSDRMTPPPGVFVDREGKVFVPAGDKLLVFEETPADAR